MSEEVATIVVKRSQDRYVAGLYAPAEYLLSLPRDADRFIDAASGDTPNEAVCNLLRLGNLEGDVK